MWKYQKEQLEIEARLKEGSRETLNDSYEKSQGVRDFLSLIRNYQGAERVGRNHHKRTHRQDTCFGNVRNLRGRTVRQEIKIYYRIHRLCR